MNTWTIWNVHAYMHVQSHELIRWGMKLYSTYIIFDGENWTQRDEKKVSQHLKHDDRTHNHILQIFEFNS